MKLLFTIFLAVIGQMTYSQTATQFSPADRSLMEATPIDFSWTNRVKVTQIERFPVSGYLNPDPIISPYVSTNKPDFTLLANGLVMLRFPFELRENKPVRSDCFLSFHISQLVDIKHKLEMFNSYRLTLKEHHVFPISLNLGEVSPSSYDAGINNCFRFTINASAEEHATLLVETGEQPIIGGLPVEYSLQILDVSQVDEVKRMLDGMPDLIWWKQKAMGIIP
jgi:hypothetical protein